MMDALCYTDNEKAVYSVTLLTPDEYVRYRENVKPLPHEELSSVRWWLKEETPHRGYGTLLIDENTHHYLDADGTVREKTADMMQNGEIFPDSVYCVCQVRPVLHMKKLTVGEQVSLNGYTFTAISGDLALCDDSIGISTYSYEKDMDRASDYECSEVKAFIESWIERTKEYEEEIER